MNKNVLILQAFSQCIEIANDVKKRGYNPVFLIQNVPKALQKDLEKVVKRIPSDDKKIKEPETYEKTLALVKKINPVFILYVSEASVELAARLSTDLKLPGNNYKYVDYYTQKDKMQLALKKYGIRYIKGEVAKNKKDAVNIFHKFGDKPVVLKPRRGLGSVSLVFCRNLNTLENFCDNYFSETNWFTDKKNTDILVQEWIEGDEYVVNTMTINGKSTVTGLWKYTFTKVGEHPIFTSYETYTPEEYNFIGLSELIQYAYDANKALKITNGPSHSEFFMDENGPVLIEANCRMMGGPLFESFLKPTFGHSESSEFADSLIFKKNIDDRNDAVLDFYYKGINKKLCSPEENIVVSMPIREIVKKFKTVHKLIADENLIGSKIPKTEDLETHIGNCYFIDEDYRLVNEENQILRMIEDKMFYMLFECKNEKPWEEYKSKGMTAKQFIKEYKVYGSMLYINDFNENCDMVKTAKFSEISKQLDNYDFGILNLKKKPKMSREKLVHQFFELCDKIKVSGHIFIPNSCFAIFPYGNKAYELLLKLAGFEIIVPKDGRRGLFAKKIRL